MNLPRALAARLVACVCAIALATGATTVNAATQAGGSSRALIVTPLSIVKYSDLDFGTIASQGPAGTVVLTPTLVPSCSTTGGLVRTGLCQPAAFFGYGQVNQTVKINLPNSPIVISNGSSTMNITNISFNGDPNLTYVSGNPSSNGYVRYSINSSGGGLFSFRVGGTLNVAAGQATGTYTGTFTVSVMYQ